MGIEGSSYLYAWITEFSVAAPQGVVALDDLEKRTATQREGNGREYDHCVLATIGSTDLVEIAYFSHIYHFFEIAETSVRSARRSIGARTLGDAEFPKVRRCDRYELCCLPELVGTETTEEQRLDQPLLAIFYLRLSAVARLCRPTAPPGDPRGQTLIDDFIQRFFLPGAPVWELYGRILKENSEAAPTTTAPRVVPLIGLDTVDAILLMRAECLEQIAAMSLAIRHQRLGSVWPAKTNGDSKPYIQTMQKFLRNPAGIDEDWEHSALFKEVRTNWGLRVERDTRGEWTLERPRDPAKPIADAAVTLSLTRVAPDRLKDSSRDLGLIGSLEEGRKIESPADHSLVLFGEFDSLLMPAVEESSHKVTVTDLRDHFSNLTGIGREPTDAFEKADPLQGGLWPFTEIAVWVRIPPEMKLPKYALLKRFREVLHETREQEFLRASDWSSLNERWINATQELGISYAATNSLVNTVVAFMGYLERDPERFSDLLPAILQLVGIVAPDETKPKQKFEQRELLWFLSRINELFAFLSRQYYPLQSPNVTLGSEGNAGYRAAGDAFIAFTRTLGEAISPKSRILVLEGVGGVLTCEFGCFRSTIFRVSPFVLHYPVFWPVASELARGRLANSPVKSLDYESRNQMESLFKKIQRQINPDDSVMHTIDRFGEALHLMADHSLGRVFTDTVLRISTALVTDLVLWRSLSLGRDSVAESHQRFWLIHGPNLVLATRNAFGEEPPRVRAINQIVLRTFFVNYLMSGDHGEASRGDSGGSGEQTWSKTLEELLAKVADTEFSFPRALDFSFRHVEQSFVHLHCWRMDLRIPDPKWTLAIRSLSESLQQRLDVSGRVVQLVDEWLKLVRSLVELWLWREPGETAVRILYCEYLSKISDDWDTADPWPPFLEHHELKFPADGRERPPVRPERLRTEQPVGGFMSLRGGIFVHGPDGLAGQRKYHRETGQLIKRLADQARELRRKQLESFLKSEFGG